jgi:hypothetical protein
MLKEVVSERPEYTYSAPEYMLDGDFCFYVHQDQEGNNVGAGCGVGVVLHRLGVPLEELRKHEGKSALQILRLVVDGASRKTARILDNFQGAQDQKMPWGEAYAKATGETI